MTDVAALEAELRETRRELRRTRAHLDLVLRAGQVTAARVDSDLRHTWVHDANPDGPSEAEILGKRDDELFPPAVAEPTMDIKRSVLETGERVDREITFEKPGGDRRYRVVAEPTRDDGTVDGVRHVAFDVTAKRSLEEREREVRSQRDTLQRLETIIESIRPINRLLNHASRRDGLDRSICDHVASSDAYDLAWIADHTPGTRHLEPTASAGSETGYLSDITVTTDDSATGHGPAGRAVRTGEVQVAHDLQSDPAFAPWREQALAHDLRASAAIPLVYDDQVYGVLNVYTKREGAFGSREQAILGELGERIGYTLHAVRNDELLHAATRIELTFTTTDSVLARASDRLDCRLDVESVVPSSGGSVVQYVTVRDRSPDDVVEFLQTADGISEARIVSDDGSTPLLEVIADGDALAHTLVTAGAVVTSDVADGGDGQVVCEVAPDADVEAIVERVRARFSDARLRAKRRVDVSAETSTDATRHLDDAALTDRQCQVLTAAYYAGHFEWPRDSTVEDMADALDVTPPTFLNHRRKGLNRLLASHLDDSPSE